MLSQIDIQMQKLRNGDTIDLVKHETDNEGTIPFQLYY